MGTVPGSWSLVSGSHQEPATTHQKPSSRRRPTSTLADVPVQWFREVLTTLPTLHAVAVAFGVSDNAVRYWRNKLWGVPPAHTVLTAALRAQLLTTLQDCAQGATVAELRGWLEQPHSAVYYGLRVLEAQGQVRRRHLDGPRRPGKRLLCWHAVR